jgi:hypothetical protein
MSARKDSPRLALSGSFLNSTMPSQKSERSPSRKSSKIPLRERKKSVCARKKRAKLSENGAFPYYSFQYDCFFFGGGFSRRRDLLSLRRGRKGLTTSMYNDWNCTIRIFGWYSWISGNINNIRIPFSVGVFFFRTQLYEFPNTWGVRSATLFFDMFKNRALHTISSNEFV